MASLLFNLAGQMYGLDSRGTGMPSSDGEALIAEGQIARILAELERKTDSIVESVQLVEREVTGVADEREVYLRNVRITLKRMPGAKWAL